MFSIFLIGMVSAVNECGNDNSFLGIFSQSENITLRQPCDSCTFVTLASVTYPNSTNQNFNVNMTQNGIIYTSYFNNTDSLGCYSYTIMGDKDGVTPATSETIDFKIGENIVGLTVILVMLLIGFGASIYGLIRGNNIAWKLLFSSLSYFLLLSLIFIASKITSNLNIPFVDGVLTVFLTILIAGILPFILFILTYLLYQIVNEKRMKRMMDMGHSRESAEQRIHKK